MNKVQHKDKAVDQFKRSGPSFSMKKEEKPQFVNDDRFLTPLIKNSSHTLFILYVFCNVIPYKISRNIIFKPPLGFKDDKKSMVLRLY